MNIKQEYVEAGLSFLNEMYKNFENLALDNNEIRKIINTKNDNPLTHFRFKVLIGPRKDLYTFSNREEQDIALKYPETLEEKIVVIGASILFNDKMVEFNTYKKYTSDEDIRKEITGDNSIVRMAKCLLNAEVERKVQEPKYIRMKYIIDLMIKERGLKDLEIKRS